MSYRPDLHTPGHDQWDQGGYCNNLVVDDDGCGVVCGYRAPREPRTPTTRTIEELIAEAWDEGYVSGENYASDSPDWAVPDRNPYREGQS